LTLTGNDLEAVSQCGKCKGKTIGMVCVLMWCFLSSSCWYSTILSGQEEGYP
jgi:hypothetical protein